ncbi:hypothetical protein B0T17DRAFT_494500 [Bombardia bombarda]|uniref:Histidine kinase group protein n=1 Tax=Bombardia bombarda TaxID=252184 RepID=A0AA40C1T9_9PEZI|nr:hypothetical protein B0T17DRAFT_494500 [Bombardia bombarda]
MVAEGGGAVGVNVNNGRSSSSSSLPLPPQSHSQSPSPSLSPSASPTMAPTPSSGKAKAPAQQPSSSALIICRNKHWRYISSFHGPWLQLPPEILEALANMNYNTPRPRPIDPAVFFDLVKIRRLVDEATNLAVRAASGVTSISQQHSLSGASHHAAALGLGYGLGHGVHTKMSRERKHRMREQATQKLSKAYHLDEIACSVATMQSASSLEEVASLVLQRNPQDAEAKYVHFFHEKIPSRQLAECTNLDTLSEIISDRPTEGEPLRTRATVRVFKEDFDGAVSDLTDALRVHRLYRPPHIAPKPQQQQQQQRSGRRQEDVILKEDDQPSSLEIQLLFQRAGVYLTIACQHVPVAFSGAPWFSQSPESPDTATSNGHGDGAACEESEAQPKPDPESTPAGKEAQARVAEARKLVRLNAKRALRDYMAYLSHFEYSPDLNIEIAKDFARKVIFAANGVRMPKSYAQSHRPSSPVSSEAAAPVIPHRIYSLSDLFAASPLSDLPPYLSTELASTRIGQSPSPIPSQTTTETLTYHPLLTDALHSLLLCHCLVQTSAKELLRHAYMVARLARLADGYPVFQASRSPARADWVEVLRSCSNWIQLVGTWEDLCAPAPLPLFQSAPSSGLSVPVPMNNTLSKQAKALPAPGSDAVMGVGSSTALAELDTNISAAEAEKQRKERICQQAVLDAFVDDRVGDESSLRLAIRARQLRAERDYRLDNAVAALDAKFTQQQLEGSTTTHKASDDIAPVEALEQIRAASNGTSNNSTTPAAGSTAADSEALAATSSDGTNGAKPTPSGNSTGTAYPTVRRWAIDDGMDYPILTDRASAVAHWVLDAPPNVGDGARKRKKRPLKKTGSDMASGSGNAAVTGSKTDLDETGVGLPRSTH